MSGLNTQDITKINRLIRLIGGRVVEMASEDSNIKEKAADDFVTEVDHEINAARLEAMWQWFPMTAL